MADLIINIVIFGGAGLFIGLAVVRGLGMF